MEKRHDDGMNITMGICFGMLAGVVIGVLTDNIGFWLSIGLCIGVAAGALLPKKKDTDKRRGREKDEE